MPIYINKNGQQSGPYEDHIVIDQLRSGVLSRDDMGIRHGDRSWQKLGDMFPNAVDEPRTGFAASSSPIGTAAPAGDIASAAAVTKSGGGCLKYGLIGAGLLLLVLGIAAAAGSRFIPSTSCDLAKSDEERIDKLRRDIEKAKSDFDFDQIGPKSVELREATTGYEISKKYCDNDKFRDNMIGIGGGVVAFVGLLMAVVGLFVGRRK